MAELIEAFLSADEVAELRGWAERERDGWKPGRQHTGYEILPLREVMGREAPIVARGLARVGTPFEDYWDVHFIRYADGASIPPHTDPAQHGRTHRRINAVLAQAERGGELLVGGEAIALGVGDAVLFSPDREVHEVSTVHGVRLLFSVGAWV